MVSQWMRRTVLAGACASVALLAACGSSTIDSAISPTRLVAFGDAMSDTGQKGTAYTVNVTDGTLRNWTEQFGAQWGLSAKPASQGGYNFAQGNARIHLKPDAAGDATTPTVQEQINRYLAGQAPGAQDIVLVGAGTSDLIAGMAQVRAGDAVAVVAVCNHGQAFQNGAMPKMCAACSAVARAASGVAATMFRCPILRPCLGALLPYKCSCAPGKASTSFHGGVRACVPWVNHRSPSRLSITVGLCWRGATKGKPAMVRTCRPNCDRSQASWL